MKRREKILLVGPSLKTYGGIVEAIKLYRTMNIPFVYLCTNNDKDIIQKILIFIASCFKCLYFFIVYKIKIVHIHSAAGTSFYRKTCIAIISKLCGKKVIFHIHTGIIDRLYYSHPKIVRFVLNKLSDKVVALSQSWSNFITSQCGCKHVIIIRNPIVSPKEVVLKNINKPLRFLYLARITTIKGIYDLLEVVKEMIEEDKVDFELYIAGIGETEKLNTYLHNPIYNSNVRYLGWLNFDEKNELLKECDVFVLPSYYEGLPLALLESMSYKLPCLVSLVGGIPDLIDGTNIAYTITPGDKKQLKEGLLYYLSLNKTELSNIGDAAYERSKLYWVENVEKELLSMYANM